MLSYIYERICNYFEELKKYNNKKYLDSLPYIEDYTEGLKRYRKISKIKDNPNHEEIMLNLISNNNDGISYIVNDIEEKDDSHPDYIIYTLTKEPSLYDIMIIHLKENMELIIDSIIYHLNDGKKDADFYINYVICKHANSDIKLKIYKKDDQSFSFEVLTLCCDFRKHLAQEFKNKHNFYFKYGSIELIEN